MTTTVWPTSTRRNGSFLMRSMKPSASTTPSRSSPGKRGRAAEAGGSRADQGHAPPVGLSRLQDADAPVQHVVRGHALQGADHDRPLVLLVEDAGALAEGLHGADPGAGMAEDVGLEDGPGRAPEVAGDDLLDEGRNVDLGGAGLDA